MAFRTGGGGRKWHLEQGVVGGNGIQNRGWWEEMAFRTGGGGRKWHLEQGVVGGNGI